MSDHFALLAYTPAVRAEQRRRLGRELPRPTGDPSDAASALPHAELGERECSFIAARDHFFLATVNEAGWPHVQHRGGPCGFLRVLDTRTLAFADYGGNRQYVSVGNLAAHPKAAIILIDHANRRRLKLLATLKVFDADRADCPHLPQVTLPDAPPCERVIVIELAAFDWNCSQHITPRFTAQEWSAHAATPSL